MLSILVLASSATALGSRRAPYGNSSVALGTTSTRFSTRLEGPTTLVSSSAAFKGAQSSKSDKMSSSPYYHNATRTTTTSTSHESSEATTLEDSSSSTPSTTLTPITGTFISESSQRVTGTVPTLTTTTVHHAPLADNTGKGLQNSGSALTSTTATEASAATSGQAATFTTSWVVSALTTYCSTPTTFAVNGNTFTVTEPTTLTITDCPCTLSHVTTVVPITTTSSGTVPGPTTPEEATQLTSVNSRSTYSTEGYVGATVAESSIIPGASSAPAGYEPPVSMIETSTPLAPALETSQSTPTAVISASSRQSVAGVATLTSQSPPSANNAALHGAPILLLPLALLI